MREFLEKHFTLTGPLYWSEAKDITDGDSPLEKIGVIIFLIGAMPIRLLYLLVRSLIEWVCDIISVIMIIIMAFTPNTRES